MTAQVLNLDDHRPRVPEFLVCLFCRREGAARVIPDQPYYPCPDARTGCEEVAAVPYWKTGWEGA